jgi:hypothetical protein
MEMPQYVKTKNRASQAHEVQKLMCFACVLHTFDSIGPTLEEVGKEDAAASLQSNEEHLELQ